MTDLLVIAMLSFGAVWFVIGMLIGDAGPERRPRPGPICTFDCDACRGQP